jgi:hypothetical protein
MTENKTDKQTLVRGFQNLGISLLLMFLGPTIVYLALSNKEKPLYIPLLVVGILGCSAAIFFAFKGINKILDSMFKKNSSD